MPPPNQKTSLSSWPDGPRPGTCARSCAWSAHRGCADAAPWTRPWLPGAAGQLGRCALADGGSCEPLTWLNSTPARSNNAPPSIRRDSPPRLRRGSRSRCGRRRLRVFQRADDAGLQPGQIVRTSVTGRALIGRFSAGRAERAPADVAAVLAAVEVDTVDRLVHAVAGHLDRVAQRRHAQHAATGGLDFIAFQARGGMEHHAVLGVGRQALMTSPVRGVLG